MLTKTKPAALMLSFVTQSDSEISFWSPDRHGEYEVDCARGRAYAEELLALMTTENNPSLFGSVLRAIVAGGTYEATEIGFCSRVGIELLGAGV